MEWIVRRVTYDKLQDSLNALAAEGWQITPHHVGSRDWVLTCKRGDLTTTVRVVGDRESLRDSVLRAREGRS